MQPLDQRECPLDNSGGITYSSQKIAAELIPVAHDNDLDYEPIYSAFPSYLSPISHSHSLGFAIFPSPSLTVPFPSVLLNFPSPSVLIYHFTVTLLAVKHLGMLSG